MLSFRSANSIRADSFVSDTGGARGRSALFGILQDDFRIALDAFVPWSSPLPVHRSQRGKVNAEILPPSK